MSTTLRTFTIAIAAILLAGCVPAMIAGAAAGGYYVGQDDRTAGQIADDGMITTRVKAALISEDDVSALHIDVDTYNTEVTLNGWVVSGAARSLAVSVASGVDGVTAVHNKLEIRADS